MPTLHELQRRFAAALFDDEPDELGADIRTDGIEPALRLGIYRSHLHACFVRALALEFPVIERLVGGSYFRRLGLDFQAAHPSRAGNLHHIGTPFAAFLRQRFSGGPYDYLADVAALEWAYQESMIASDARAFDPDALRRIDPADYAQLHFGFHPACRLLSSAYPVLNIWRANQPNAAAGPVIDLASGATRVLVHRRGQAVEFHLLTAAGYALLAALAQDSSLGAAMDAAQKADAAFDLGRALRQFVALGALTTVILGRSSL